MRGERPADPRNWVDDQADVSVFNHRSAANPASGD
jgi:hypothetical protein